MWRELTTDPTILTNKIRVDIFNWKYVPSIPRISFSTISNVYCGITVEIVPAVNPIKSMLT